LSFFGGSCDNNGGSFIGGAIPGFFSLIGATLALTAAAGAIPGFGSFFAASGAPGSITSSGISLGWGVAIVEVWVEFPFDDYFFQFFLSGTLYEVFRFWRFL
jgi:hypothetical protein